MRRSDVDGAARYLVAVLRPTRRWERGWAPDEVYWLARWAAHWGRRWLGQ